MAGPEPWKREVSLEALREILERDGEKAAGHHRWQFRFLVLGGVLFVAWHVLQIALRSSTAPS